MKAFSIDHGYTQFKHDLLRSILLFGLTGLLGLGLAVLALLPGRIAGNYPTLVELTAHTVAFAVFSAMLFASFLSTGTMTGRINIVTSAALTIIACGMGAILSEYLQLEFIQERSYELRDLFADAIGITIGVVIAVLISRNQI